MFIMTFHSQFTFLRCSSYWIIIDKEFIFLFDPMLFGIEGILLLIPCLFYIFELLKSNLVIDLKSNPNFISTCGCYFTLVSQSQFGSAGIIYITSPGA